MANSDSVKAITTNITSILTTQGLSVEDISGDPETDTITLAQIHYQGEDFEYAHGMKPLYNEINYLIRMVFNKMSPVLSRDAQAEWIHKVREAITVNALNVGSLATTKLVSLVEHEGADVEYRPPISTINYKLKVRYREI